MVTVLWRARRQDTLARAAHHTGLDAATSIGGDRIPADSRRALQTSLLGDLLVLLLLGALDRNLWGIGLSRSDVALDRQIKATLLGRRSRAITSWNILLRLMLLWVL